MPPLTALESPTAADATPQVVVERLTGEEARRYWDVRVAKNPVLQAAYHRSRAQMERRGFHATWTVHVERRFVKSPVGRAADSVLTQVANLLVAQLSAAQHSESNQSGEFIASSWDDGDDDTWGGSIYVERYSDGAWRLFDAQLDAGTTATSSNEPEYHVFEGGRGGSGPGGPLPVNGQQPRSLAQCSSVW